MTINHTVSVYCLQIWGFQGHGIICSHLLFSGELKSISLILVVYCKFILSKQVETKLFHSWCVSNKKCPIIYTTEIILMNSRLLCPCFYTKCAYVFCIMCLCHFLLKIVSRCCVSLPGKHQQVHFGLSEGHPSLPRYWSNHCYI